MRTLEITVAVPCDNRCSYCPQDLLEKSYKGEKVLSFDNFVRILANTPKDVRIHFSGFCEPFQNPDTPKMMRYAQENGYKLVLYTTLVGLKENIDDIKFDIKSIHNRKIRKEDQISRAGNLWKRESKQGNLKCGNNDFDNNVVLPNGDVYLCCMDYGLKHKLGNIFTTHFDNLKREPPFDLCRYCEFSILI